VPPGPRHRASGATHVTSIAIAVTEGLPGESELQRVRGTRVGATQPAGLFTRRKPRATHRATTSA
jgi:hypothetical protein